MKRTLPTAPLAALAIALWAAPALLVAPAMLARPASAADDPLVALNKLFRKAYASEREAFLNRSGPVVVVAFDDLVLFRDGKSERAGFTPPIYHEAKAIAHIPLTLYVWFQARAGKPLDQAFLAMLKDYRAHVAAAEKSLAGRKGWSEEALKLHKGIVALSLALIDRATRDKRLSAKDLSDYAASVRQPILASGDVAARAQLDGLHALVGQWRKRFGADFWKRATVVVLTVRQARQDYLQYTYFRSLMGREAENKRLFIAENIFSDKGGRNLAGTILLDRGASTAFFGDPLRLERDFLGDAAARHVRRLLRRR